MQLDLEWPEELSHRKGSAERLHGIDVFHDFDWEDVFRHGRGVFPNGKSLAAFAKQKCAQGKTPALLLTQRKGEQQGIRQTRKFSVCVVNIDEFREASGNAALTYLATHLDIDISDINELTALINRTDPKLIETYLEGTLTMETIEGWAVGDPGNLDRLADLVVEEVAGAELLAKVLTGKAQDAEQTRAEIAALAKFLETADEGLVHNLIAQPEVLNRVYQSNPGAFRSALKADSSSGDIIALEHRKKVVEEFRLLLKDDDLFQARQAASSRGGPEGVWQEFIESNPWILGIGLSGQLFTSFDADRLEQAVVGPSIGGRGKRVDAVLRTAGLVRAIAFAEIKHHKTPLLGDEYRRECWAPSKELSGAIVQVQRYVQITGERLGKRLAETDDEGAETGEATWIVRPRSFLIIGHSNEFKGASGGVLPYKFESFELLRRNLYEPEVLTFDELLARAEWHVLLAEHEETLDPAPAESAADGLR